MADINEQIEAIEKEIRETPYHKGTEHHIGMLRARIARLKDKEFEAVSKSGGGGGTGYSVRKQGDATIVLVGPPSVGKSTLINKLTNAKSKIAPYAFTTVSVIPGMMEYRGARIQILDVPGLIEGAETGKGRGREVLSVIRGADLLLIITQPDKLDEFKTIWQSLEKHGIRVNKTRPKVFVEKKVDGGLFVKSNLKIAVSKETVKSIAQEMGVKNGIVNINEKINTNQLIDVFSKNRVYVKAIFVLNKSDLRKKEKVDERVVQISARDKKGVDKLLEKIWEKLEFVTVYLVQPNKQPDQTHPIVVNKSMTLKEVGQTIGNNFIEDKTHAVIWGNGAKFEGQEVSLDTKVIDQMMIRFE